MAEKTVSPRTYTVADLYSEAAKLVREEFTAMKSKPLSREEEEKLEPAGQDDLQDRAEGDEDRMSIKGPGEKPFVPQITPKEIKPEKAPEEKLTPQPAVKAPVQPGIGRGPELDAHAIATRLAILATEAKEKELKFEDIIDRVIAETGMTNPQGALEEANRRVPERDRGRDRQDQREQRINGRGRSVAGIVEAAYPHEQRTGRGFPRPPQGHDQRGAVRVLTGSCGCESCEPRVLQASLNTVANVLNADVKEAMQGVQWLVSRTSFLPANDNAFALAS